ncbi:helix-turn-helix domain-containing protein [Streptomyces sp. NPDC088766]|uniref:helix-turn-helix domain-containing protein n=1 Tax=Streptomyces sp. NPDC088766 TaxID=3365893 RepID=UPI00381717CE
MRYPQGGGLTVERQQFREELRLKAADGFAQGEASSVIAKDLQVSVRFVQRWRRMWDEGGPRARRPCWRRPRSGGAQGVTNSPGATSSVMSSGTRGVRG